MSGRSVPTWSNICAAIPRFISDLTFLVRQLAPTDRGLPIEVYVFSSEQRWVQYEAIQADIFDHIYAVLPQCDLRPFQNPSGSDIERGLRGAAESRPAEA